MRHLSSLILLFLSLFTSCTHIEVLVETCIGETASFEWDYEVPPFYAVEWYFGKTQIAETLDEHLSQESISINDNYKSRFVLLEKDTVGFNLINVNRDDEGDYKCILTLQSTDILVEKKGTLNVKDEVELSTVTDSPGNVLPVDKAVVIVPIVSIVAIFAIAVIVVVFWKKRRCFAEKRSVSLKAKTRSESHELMEDKSKSPVANGKVSHCLVKQEDKEA